MPTSCRRARSRPDSSWISTLKPSRWCSGVPNDWRCDRCQSGAYVGLVVATSAGAGAFVLVALSAVAGTLLPPIAPVARVVLREVFDDVSLRDTAYALDAVAQETIWIAGPLVVALVIALTSPEFDGGPARSRLRQRHAAVRELAAGAPLGRAAGVAASVARRSPARSCGRCSGRSRSPGWRLARSRWGCRRWRSTPASRPASGLLLALWSVGSMTGGLWYGSRVWRSSLVSRYQLLLGLAVVCTAPLIAARTIDVAIVCAVLAGLTVAPVFSCSARAGRPIGGTGHRDRGVHLDLGGAHRRPRRGLCDRRRGGGPARYQRAVCDLVRDFDGGRADRRERARRRAGLAEPRRLISRGSPARQSRSSSQPSTITLSASMPRASGSSEASFGSRTVSGICASTGSRPSGSSMVATVRPSLAAVPASHPSSPKRSSPGWIASSASSDPSGTAEPCNRYSASKPSAGRRAASRSLTAPSRAVTAAGASAGEHDQSPWRRRQRDRRPRGGLNPRR